MTSIIDEIVPILRRAINDSEEPYVYSDSRLADYICDAIGAIGISWNHGYSIDRDNHEIEPEVDLSHMILFVMQAKLDMLTMSPDISFSTDSLSVTRKADNKKRLERTINKAVNNIKALGAVALTSTEFDDYKTWLREGDNLWLEEIKRRY